MNTPNISKYFYILIIIFAFTYVTSAELPYDFYGFKDSYYHCDDNININNYLNENGLYYIISSENCDISKNNTLVVFIPGWTAVIIEPYYFFLEHIARMGYTILYPTYSPIVNATHYTDYVYSMLKSSLVNLNNKNIDVKNIVIFGHSSGGTIAINIASRIADNSSMPSVKALMLFEPGNGSTAERMNPIKILRFPKLELEDVSDLNSNITLIMITGIDSTPDFENMLDTIYDNTTTIPASNKHILQFRNAEHNGLALQGNHYLPLSWGISVYGIGQNELPVIYNMLDTIDGGLDFFYQNIYDYKLWDLFDNLILSSTEDKTICNISDQTYIGTWPDGTEIDKLTILK